jgi:PAS domain S-box-containing protein
LSLITWLVLLVAGAVVPLLLFAAFTVSQLASAYRERDEQAQADTTAALGLAVDAELRAWKAALFALAESNDLTARNWAGLHAEASRVAARYDGWIILTDATGQQLLHTLRPYGTPLPTSPEIIRAVFTDPKPTVTDVFLGKVTQRLVVSVVVPVLREGRAAYVMDLAVGVDRLSRLLEQQALPSSWVAGINDRQGRVVARSVDAAQRVGQPARGWMPDRAGVAPSGMFTAVLGDGRETRTAFRRLTEAPWVLVLAVPTAELHAVGPPLGFVVTGVVLTLVAVGVALGLGRKIAAPVTALADHSEAVVRGELPALPAGGSREIERLHHALTQAAEKVQVAYREQERAARAEEAAKVASASAGALQASEAAARQHAARVQALLDAAPALIWVTWDRECRTIIGNRAAHAVSRVPDGVDLSKTGTAPERLAHYRVFHHGVELAPHEMPIQRVAASGQPLSDYAMEFVFADGAVRSLVGNVTPLLDAAGQPAGAIAAFVDVTERQRVEEALRRSEDRFRRYFELGLVGMAITSPTKGILEANDEICQILGYERAELTQKTWAELTHPDDRAADAAQFERVLAGEIDGYALDKRWIRKDGAVIDTSIAVRAVRRPDGAVEYFVALVQDVTERKRAEAALAASQRLLHSILQQAPDGITVRDAQGCVMFVNGVARRRALRRPEGTPLAMAPEIWGEYLNADGTPVPVDEWPAARALRGETATREFLRRTPTGSLFVLNSAAPLRNDQGEIIGAVTMTTDITDRRRMENQLRDALGEKEAALATNLTLLREVHHRVKNNLQMLCDMMYLQMEAMPDRNEHQDLQDAYGRIYAVARLHEHLYQSMRSGQVVLRDYLTQVAHGFEDLRPKLAIRVEVPPEPLYLDMDAAIHAGLIANELITNAAKHAFPKGEPGEVAVSLRAADGYLELQVRDAGKGLPAGVDVTRPKSLGLRLVNILAAGLHGTVTVASLGGVAVTVRFPIKEG